MGIDPWVPAQLDILDDNGINFGRSSCAGFTLASSASPRPTWDYAPAGCYSNTFRGAWRSLELGHKRSGSRRSFTDARIDRAAHAARDYLFGSGRDEWSGGRRLVIGRR